MSRIVYAALGRIFFTVSLLDMVRQQRCWMGVSIMVVTKSRAG